MFDLLRGGWVDSVQVIFNLFEQEPAAELLDVAREGAWRDRARRVRRGALTGKCTTARSLPRMTSCAYFEGDRLGARRRAHRSDSPGSRRQRLYAAAGRDQVGAAHPAVSTVITGIRNITQAGRIAP